MRTNTTPLLSVVLVAREIAKATVASCVYCCGTGGTRIVSQHQSPRQPKQGFVQHNGRILGDEGKTGTALLSVLSPDCHAQLTQIKTTKKVLFPRFFELCQTLDRSKQKGEF